MPTENLLLKGKTDTEEPLGLSSSNENRCSIIQAWIYIRDKQNVFSLPKPMMPAVLSFFNIYFFLFIHLLFVAAPGS